MYDLAQFPLQLVAFPGEELNLHIFEPRYKQLINDCKTNQMHFGIPPVIEGKLMEFGTKMTLEKVVKTYDDGRMDIQTVGVSLYRIIRFSKKTDTTTYGMAQVVNEPLTGESDENLRRKIISLLNELYRILRIRAPLQWDEGDILAVVHKLGLDLEEEYQILSCLHKGERQQIIYQHLEKIIPQIKEAEFIRRKIQMNGHFKHIIPPNIK